MADWRLINNFSVAVKTVVAREALNDQILPEHVQRLSFASGSVIVTATIVPPADVNLRAVINRLENHPWLGELVLAEFNRMSPDSDLSQFLPPGMLDTGERRNQPMNAANATVTAIMAISFGWLVAMVVLCCWIKRHCKHEPIPVIDHTLEDLPAKEVRQIGDLPAKEEKPVRRVVSLDDLEGAMESPPAKEEKRDQRQDEGAMESSPAKEEKLDQRQDEGAMESSPVKEKLDEHRNEGAKGSSPAKEEKLDQRQGEGAKGSSPAKEEKLDEHRNEGAKGSSPATQAKPTRRIISLDDLEDDEGVNASVAGELEEVRIEVEAPEAGEPEGAAAEKTPIEEPAPPPTPRNYHSRVSL